MATPTLHTGPDGLGFELDADAYVSDGWVVRRLIAGPGLDGPPGILQGGFAAGVGLAAARAVDRLGAPLTRVSARLAAPTPLGVELELAVRPTDAVATYEVVTRHDGRVLVAAEVELAGHDPAPRAFDLQELADVPLPEPVAQEAFPVCWGCGAHAQHPLALRLPPRPYATGVEVVPWVAQDPLSTDGETVDDLVVCAALDCPTQWAAYPAIRAAGGAGGLLGGYEVRWYREPPVMEALRLVARHDGNDGRKHRARSAIVDEDGVVYAIASALMVAVPAIPRLDGGASPG